MKYRIINLLSVLIAISICVSLFVALPFIVPNTRYVGWIMFLATILSSGLLALSLRKKKFLRTELVKEVKYIFHNSSAAWIIGLTIATFISSIVLIALGATEDDVHVLTTGSAYDIMGVYVSSVLGVLAIRAFYKSLHPIYDELELIRLITLDLDKARRGISVWFSFPALNLCQFRTLTHLVSGGLQDYPNYERALKAKIDDPLFEFHGICYKSEHINHLFETYGEMNKNEETGHLLDYAVKNCKNTACNFVDSIISAKKNSLNSTYHEMNPENPIESFVIIGDIVYTISAWGLPVFRLNSDGQKTFVNPFKSHPESKLVKLIAYRQHDGELASTIITKTKMIIGTT